MVRAIGCAVSLGFNEEEYSAVNPWLGRGLVARLDATFRAVRGIGEGGFWKRSGGNGGDGRRLNPIMSQIRNNLFIKFTASLEFVSGWFPVRFRLRFRNKWLNYAIYQHPGNEKLLFLLKKDL